MPLWTVISRKYSRSKMLKVLYGIKCKENLNLRANYYPAQSRVKNNQLMRLGAKAYLLKGICRSSVINIARGIKSNVQITILRRLKFVKNLLFLLNIDKITIHKNLILNWISESLPIDKLLPEKYTIS